MFSFTASCCRSGAALALAASTTAAAALLAPPAVGAAPGPGAPHPTIDVRATSQDDGSVEEGTVARFRFSVVNRGPADLEIQQVKPSCGCTVPRWEPRIKAGAEGHIEAEMNTVGFSGPVTKHLTVFSNDPEKPQIELTISARVTPQVEIIPGPAALLVVEDKPVTREFTLRRTGGRPMRILEAIPGSPYVNAAVTRLPGEGCFKLAVTASAETPRGHSVVPVSVRTDLEKSATLTLIVMVDRGIVAAPQQLFYNVPFDLKVPVRNAVTIYRLSGAFHVTGVSVDDPKLQAKLETVREGLEYRVTVTYSGGWDTWMVHRMLTATTDDPKQPILKIPVEAVVRTGGADPGTSPGH